MSRATRGIEVHVAIVSKTFVATTAQRQLEWIARQPDTQLSLVTPDVWKSDDGRDIAFRNVFTSNYAVARLPVVFNGHYHFYLYRRLRKTLTDLKVDLIHIDEEPYNPAGLQSQRIADALGVPTVFVAWQNILRDYPVPYRKIEQYNYARTSHIIAGNTAAADVLRKKRYSGPLSVFSLHGVDPEIYAPGNAVKPTGKLHIGYVGRVVHYKGIEVLLRAVAGLPESCELRIIGSGPDEQLYRGLTHELSLQHRVTFSSAVDAGEIPALLRTLDVLVLPSLTQKNWKEQFGRVLIEAMSCGVPVVGSDSGEIPEVISNAGVIVPEGDSDALRQALLKLALDSGLRQQLAEAGRRRVLERFTQEQVARETRQVYADAMQFFQRRASSRTR